VFDKLTERLQGVVDGLRGKGRLTEDNIADTLRQVRMALLEADVALPVVKSLIESIKSSIVGTEFDKPFDQDLIRSIHQELIKVLGGGVRPINCANTGVGVLASAKPARPPASKLARWLRL
jgi:signal recognition particle subunit SRP54